MLKVIGALLILFAGTAIGFVQAARFAQRPKQIRALLHLLQRLETEIGYGHTPLPEALERAAAQVGKPLADMLVSVVAKLAETEGVSMQQCWEQAVAEHWPATALGANEQGVLMRLGSSLGTSDREDQIRHLRLAMSQLQAEEGTAREDQAKYEKMCRSLGVLAGALVVILMV